MKSIKGKQFLQLVTSPRGRTSDRETCACMCTYKYTNWYTCTGSHPHISCVFYARQSSFSSVQRGNVGLMTFPMRHKHCMWEADSSAARVFMWEPLCIYVWVCEELDTYVFFMHLLEASCVFTSLCFWETSHAHLFVSVTESYAYVYVFIGSVHI